MTTITMFQFTFQAFALLLVIALASEAATALNDVGYWRSLAFRYGAMCDAYSLAGMFRAYGHADDAFNTAGAHVVMILLLGLAGLAVAFIG